MRSQGALQRYVRCVSSDVTVHVWSAHLSSVPPTVSHLLSGDERARAARMRVDRSRVRWVAARGLLRLLLGEWIGEDPSLLRFENRPHRKPSLIGAQVRFNVSHSDDRVLYAISASREVGVDIEVVDRHLVGRGEEGDNVAFRPRSGRCDGGEEGASRRRGGRRDDVAVARRVLGEATAARLAQLQEPQRSEEFLKAWVAHEACVKCLGVGIARFRDAGEHASPRPWVTELKAGPGAFAALAVQGGPVQVVMAEWWPRAGSR